MLLTNLSICTPTGFIDRGWIRITENRIAAVGQGPVSVQVGDSVFDGQGLTALPGFIDLHTHGFGDAHTMQATQKAFTQMAEGFARYGVTAFCATTITDSSYKINRVLEVVGSATQADRGARLLGVHLEGPYINPQAHGAQPIPHIRPADPKEYMPWFATGLIKQITVAPEFTESHPLIEAARAHNIICSIGHSRATYDEVVIAIDLGVTQATHTFNAMTPLHHRTPGTVGAVLARDEIVCELIADAVHIDPTVLRIAVRAKGIENIILITDAEFGTGLAAGTYQDGDRTVIVNADAVLLSDGTLAGSVLTMDRALRVIMQATGLSVQQAWPMTSFNAARQLGIAQVKGSLSAGYDADIVLLDDALTVAMTMREGTIVYQRS